MRNNSPRLLREIKQDIFPLYMHKPIGNYTVLTDSMYNPNLRESAYTETFALSRHPDVQFSYERHNLHELYINHYLKYDVNDISYELAAHGLYETVDACVNRDVPISDRTRDIKGDFIMSNYKDKFENIVDNCERSILSYIKNSVKNHFGKEFDFSGREMHLCNTVTNEFIQKYDKKFKRHIVDVYKGQKNVIVNNQFIVKLDGHTFMYVAAGDKIGDIRERYMMSIEPLPDDLYIYIFGKYCRKYIKELKKIIYKITENVDLGIYVIDADRNSRKEKTESIDVIYYKLHPRYLDTLFFSHGEKEEICKHINKFNDNEIFYKEKQLLYKTGILLYGEPGTGKSSLVKAIATKYDRSIITLNMSNIEYIDLNKLTQSVNVDEYRRYIILLEDIDTLFLNRVNGQSDKEDNAVINKLLQFLDSNTSPTNVIFIATTNHIDRLDDALLREGRFDLKVEVHPLDEKEAIMFGESFGLSKDTMLDVLLELGDEPNYNGTYNQSKLQNRILGRLENTSIDVIKNRHGEMEE